MNSGRRQPAALITTARTSRTLDTDARRRRYLWTMAVRVGCFIAATLTPMPWNLLLILAAAGLPAIAVLLANAIDQRSPAEPETSAPDLPQLSSAQIVDGVVSEE